MAKAYRFTQGRRVALHRAQLISARKRKGRGVSPKAKRVMKATGIAVTAGAVVGTAVVARQRHVRSGSSLTIHKGPRTATPMIRTIDKAGTQGILVPGTRAGLRVSGFGKKHGFSVSYTSRTSKGDKIIASYRHIPLPKGTALFGKQMDKSPAEVTGWQPTTAAHPSEIDNEVFSSIVNRNPLSDEGKAYRNAEKTARWLSKSLKSRQNKDTTIGRTHIYGNKVPQIEIQRRVNEYMRIMGERGITPNTLHRDSVLKKFMEGTR